MSVELADLVAIYGDLPNEDLLRRYHADLEKGLNAPVPDEVRAVDGERRPTERQLRAWKDSTVGGPSGAYARGYAAGYGD